MVGVDVFFVSGFGQGDEVAGKLQSYLHLFYVGKYVARIYRGYFQYLGVEIVFFANTFDDVVFFFGAGGVVSGQNNQGLQECGKFFSRRLFGLSYKTIFILYDKSSKFCMVFILLEHNE